MVEGPNLGGTFQPDVVSPVVLETGTETPRPTSSIPTERGSDRFLGQIFAVMGSVVTVLMGGPAGERIGSGLAVIVNQDSSELVVRAYGNIGSGLGIVAGIVASGVVLYRVFRR